MTKIRQFFGNFTKWEFNGILKFLRLDASLNEKLNLSSNILKSRDNCNQYGRDDQSCSSVASIVEETEAPCYFVIVISANIQLTDIILNVVSQSYILGSWTTTFVVISWNVSPKSFQCTQAFSCHHSLSCNPEIKDYFLFILWFFFFFFFYLHPLRSITFTQGSEGSGHHSPQCQSQLNGVPQPGWLLLHL